MATFSSPRPENQPKKEDEKIFGTESGGIKYMTSCDHQLDWLSSDLAHIPTLDTPCSRCQHRSENWLCLYCKEVLCGRYANMHMLQHYQETNHCLVLSYRNMSVWCCACDAYLYAQAILHMRPVHETACILKFGEADVLPSHMSVTHPSISQISDRKRSISEDKISIGIEKMVSTFQQAHIDTMQNMSMISQRLFDSNKNDDDIDIAEELASMRLSMRDELQALNLILEKPSNMRTFKSVQGCRERKLVYVEMLLDEKRGIPYYQNFF